VAYRSLFSPMRLFYCINYSVLLGKYAIEVMLLSSLEVDVRLVSTDCHLHLAVVTPAWTTSI